MEGPTSNRQTEHLDDAVLISPASPIESSPLSSPPGEPDIKAVETYEDEVTDTYEDEATVAHEDEAANGARKSGSAGTTPPVHEGSAKDERNLPFECPDCEKAYATEKSLKRHINDKKSVCFKGREAYSDILQWTCPRCQVQLAKKSSVARHIRDSCWKICDECCKKNHINCDALNMEDKCTNCEEAGTLCTKHTEPVADCAPKLLTVALADPDKQSQKKRSTGKKRSEKRKAVKSPDGSPKAKPKAKSRRKTLAKEEEQANHVDEADERDQSGHESEDNVHNMSPPRFSRSNPEGRNGRQPPRVGPRVPPGSQGYLTIDAAVRSARQLPPPPGYGSYNNSPATPHGTGMPEMLRRQVLAVQGMQQYAPGYGAAMRPAYPAPVMSSTRSSLHLGRSDPRDVLQPHGQENGQPYRDLHQMGNARRRPMSPLVVPPPMPTYRPRQRHVDEAPEPYQPTAKASRPSRNDMPPNQTEIGHNRNVNATARLVVKLPISRELNHQLSNRPQPPQAHPQNPQIRLRIHSNSFDPNNDPIFSILTLRMYDDFGPRLQYYSHTRGRNYGVDWKFIYCYPAPTPQQPGRKKYFDLTWNAKPAWCRDHEYPGADMRDGDTIWVVKRRTPVPVRDPGAAAAGAYDVEDSVQLPPDMISIDDGEQLYQSPAVNAMWYSGADAALEASRAEIGTLENMVHQERIKVEKCEDTIAELEARNAELVWQLRGARHGNVTGSNFVGRQSAVTGPAHHHHGLVCHAADKTATGEGQDDDQEIEM